MKLLFVTTAPVAFDVGTPEREPLGGTESCVCYLARALAERGHQVTLLANLAADCPPELLGIRHMKIETLYDKAFCARECFDAFICLSDPTTGAWLKKLDPKAFNVAWIHLLPDQPALHSLPTAQQSLDCAVFVSETQRASIPTSAPTHVIGNGIAPAFENMFSSAAELLAAKQDRAVYTTTPFRGLAVLINVMERMETEIDLDVYSSMRTYQLGDEEYAEIFVRADRHPRIHRHGAVSQKALAHNLRQAAFLAYPCVFEETYCITALEAMAAGLKVVSTDLGALPETTLGYADLLPIHCAGLSPEESMQGYIALFEKNIAGFRSEPQAWAERQFDQLQAVNRACVWRVRALEWENFLVPAVAWKQGGA